MSTVVGRRLCNIFSHSYHSNKRHLSSWKASLKPVISILGKSQSASYRQFSSTFNRPPESPNYPKKGRQLWKSPVSPIMTSTSDSEGAATKGQDSPGPATTTATTLPEEIQAAKDKYLNMEIDDKRAHYRCGEKYFTLERVRDWPAYFVRAKVPQAKVLDEAKKSFPVNNDLNSKVSLWQGDITALEIDAIVNAANSSLLGGGGVDGAIHRAAGRRLLYECRELDGCSEGGAKITGGYRLPAKHVIHTVGPQEEKKEILRSCYVNSLELMLQNNLRSIAFPCIGTGIYGYPRIGAAIIALTTVREFLEKNADKVDRVIFTVFLNEDKKVYETLLQKYFPLDVPEQPEEMDTDSKTDEAEPEAPKAKTEEAEPNSPKAKTEEAEPKSPKAKPEEAEPKSPKAKAEDAEPKSPKTKDGESKSPSQE